MPQFDVYGNFGISLDGRGKVYDRIKSTFDPFESDSVAEIDIEVITNNEIREPRVDSILGGPEEFYANSDDEFVYIRYGEPAIVSNDFNTIRCSPDAPPDFVRLLVEYKLRLKLLKMGLSLIHASGVRYNEETIVFPAWTHTGKTNTMLTFLQNGASYLSDDRLFIGEDAKVRGYPTDLHLMSYNYQSFQDLAPDSPVSEARSFISEKVNYITKSRSSIVSKGINLANEAVIAEDHWVSVNQKFPNADIVLKDELDKIVLLRTTSADKPYIETVSGSSLAESLSSINYREWDLDLLEIGSASKSLIDDLNQQKPVKNMIESQNKIFQRASNEVNTAILHVPREEQWTQNTKDDILSLVSDL